MCNVCNQLLLKLMAKSQELPTEYFAGQFWGIKVKKCKERMTLIQDELGKSLSE